MPLGSGFDDRHSWWLARRARPGGERHALGRTDEVRPLHVTFTLRGAASRIRVISARDMSRKERARYAQES
jgi:uncharacterized DUF497 family protein